MASLLLHNVWLSRARHLLPCLSGKEKFFKYEVHKDLKLDFGSLAEILSRVYVH